MIENSSDREIALSDLWRLLNRYRWQILLGAVAGGTLLLAIILMLGRTYTVPIAFVPQATNSSALGGLAAQFGLAVPAQDPSQNPLFYSKLITSEGFLRNLVASTVKRDGKTVTVASLLGADESALAGEREAVLAAREALTVESDMKTGIVRITVRTADPHNSLLIAQQTLTLIDGFNLGTRRSRATQERVFAEARSRELQSELAVAENRLRAFRERNRDIRFSPEMLLESERLARDVLRLQGVYLTVSQAYEQARLDEVHDTPVITIVEAPRAPLAPDPRGALRLTVLGVVAGALAGLAVGATRSTLLPRT
jgi:uncharacterized protein involved in exopolysaccharide biosynthesis